MSKDTEKSPSQDPFGRAITEMPRIVEVVNSLTSPEVQKSSFDYLTGLLGAPIAPVIGSIERTEEPEAQDVATPDAAAKGDSKPRSRRRRGKSYSPTKGLNFAPDGVPSLEELIASKIPRNNDERNLLACYYLTEHMGLKAETENVFAVYQAAEWTPASHPHTALQNTASKLGWLDTSDMSDIEVLWKGKTFIESKMPVETAKKKAA